MALTREDQKRALEEGGLGTLEMYGFQKSVLANEKVTALSDKVSGDKSIGDETRMTFLRELGKKWKTDRELFTKLEADMDADPKLAEEFHSAIKNDPERAIKAIQKYDRPGSLSLALKSGAGAAAPSISESSSPAASPAASPASGPAPTAPAGSAAKRDDNARDIATLGMMAEDLAKAAKEFGVPASTADGFVRRIKTDSVLARRIAENFKRNPDFLSMVTDQVEGTPKTGPIAQKAAQELNKIMSKPELLAEDSYVKGLERDIKNANAMKASLAGVTAGFGNLAAGFRKIMGGLSGPHKVFSMSSPGGSLFPTLFINLDAYEQNAAEATAFGAYSPLEMDAYTTPGKNGKFFHDGQQRKGADGKPLMKDGKPVFEQVPNGQITLTTADGKEVKVIPAGGNLMAKQRAGDFGPDGKFIPGNIKVPVVMEITEHGVPSKIDNVMLTPAQFKQYNRLVDAAAQKAGRPTGGLVFEPYTEQDKRELAARSEVKNTANIVTVDPATGRVVSESNPSVTAWSIGADGSVIQNPTGRPAANERDFRLQSY
ncbi:MAG: hypothetical protein JNL76_06770 [Alphaproteobacteria bacterium]|nr:hypothetical protein [Alphaproteobacteria bacterium]